MISSHKKGQKKYDARLEAMVTSMRTKVSTMIQSTVTRSKAVLQPMFRFRALYLTDIFWPLLEALSTR
jgi:hypothetical protein